MSHARMSGWGGLMQRKRKGKEYMCYVTKIPAGYFVDITYYPCCSSIHHISFYLACLISYMQ